MMATFDKHLHLPVTCLTRGDVLLAKLEGVTDPERKRKIIGADFVETFTEHARQLEAALGGKPAFLVQVGIPRLARMVHISSQTIQWRFFLCG